MKNLQKMTLLLIVMFIALGTSFASDEFEIPVDHPNLDLNVTIANSSYNDTTFNTPSMDLSHLNDDVISSDAAILPSRYNLNDLGRVTPVKAQGEAGVCWTFASLSSLESNLLPGETWDFSENHMKNLLSNKYPDGFDRNFSDGGNAMQALAYLARYSGPVLETSDPYNATSAVSPSGLKPVKHVQNMYIIPGGGGALDINLLKKAIMQYGGITCGMIFSEAYYNETFFSYYLNTTKVNGSERHDICVVGWDDNFNKSNFTITPPGNGAWIIKNSWGTEWGDKGYFYLSYYDVVLGKNNDNSVFVKAEPTTNYNEIYQYDPLGWITQIGLSEVSINTPTPSTAWLANRFTALSNRTLAAVSFYAPTANAAYEIYLAVGNINGTKYTLNKGNLVYPGYHTIKLNQLIPLIQGKDFYVIIKLTTPNFNSPICVEYPMENFSSKAKASKNQSFVSMDGKKWTDLTDELTNTNVCIKAFTINSANLELVQETSNIQPTEDEVFQLVGKVSNYGPDSARDVKVTNQLSQGIRILSYSTSQGNYYADNGVWDLGEVESGETKIITFFCVIDDPGDFLYFMRLASGTYDPEDANETSSLSINAKPDVEAAGVPVTVGTTVAMQPTGMPLTPFIVAIILIILGTIHLKQKQ